MILVYVTNPDMAKAKEIASALMTKRFIACANFLPVTSMNWWNGAVESGEEVVMVLKTKASHWEKVRDEVLRMHPYQNPCIMKIQAEAHAAYEDWVNAEVW